MREPTEAWLIPRRQAHRLLAGVLLAILVAAGLAAGLSRRCCGRLVPRWSAMNCCGSDTVCDRTRRPACAPPTAARQAP